MPFCRIYRETLFVFSPQIFYVFPVDFLSFGHRFFCYRLLLFAINVTDFLCCKLMKALSCKDFSLCAFIKRNCYRLSKCEGCFMSCPVRVAATTSPQPDKSENLHKAPGPNGYWYILLYIWLYYWEWPYYFPPLVAPLRQPLVAANAEFRHRLGTGQNCAVTLEPQSFQGFLWFQKVGYFFFRPRLLQRGTEQ